MIATHHGASFPLFKASRNIALYRSYSLRQLPSGCQDFGNQFSPNVLSGYGHRITKRAIDQMETNGRDVLRWDADVKGFGVRRRTSGAKFYVLKMRVGGRQRWITIGRHGSPWTPEQSSAKLCDCLG